jgi:hypothetical protein
MLEEACGKEAVMKMRAYEWYKHLHDGWRVSVMIYAVGNHQLRQMMKMSSVCAL